MKNARLESGVNCFYARKNQQGEYSEIIMPEKNGILINRDKELITGWYKVAWPLNPHFTGERGILEMLNTVYNQEGGKNE